MQRGYLVYNYSLKQPKFEQMYDMLIHTMIKHNIELTPVANNDVDLRSRHNPDMDFVIFWDKDTRLAYQLEQMGYRLFNCAASIAMCDDKALTYARLYGHVDMPITYVVPLSFERVDSDYIDKVGDIVRYPLVVKKCFGSFGQQVHKCDGNAELRALANKWQSDFIIQQYIAPSCGRDVRIYTVGGKAALSLERSNNIDFRSNVTNGGVMRVISPPREFVDMAEKASRLLELDWAGVDILYGDLQPLLCEVNSNPHIMSAYNVSQINVADMMAEHIASSLHKETN